MSKIKSLTENSEFRRLYNRGKSFVSPALVTYLMPNRAGYCRIGITTSKKIGGAVIRNRARRVIRASFQNLFPLVIGNYDIVFVARGKTAYMKSYQIEKQMENQLVKAKIIDFEGIVKEN